MSTFALYALTTTVVILVMIGVGIALVDRI